MTKFWQQHDTPGSLRLNNRTEYDTNQNITMMAKQQTIHVESREESDGFPYSRVRTCKEHLADIYFLDSGTCKGYLYCIEYPNGFWDTKEFETEEAAVNHVAQHYRLGKQHHQVQLSLCEYFNSERGAIRRTA